MVVLPYSTPKIPEILELKRAPHVMVMGSWVGTCGNNGNNGWVPPPNPLLFFARSLQDRCENESQFVKVLLRKKSRFERPRRS